MITLTSDGPRDDTTSDGRWEVRCSETDVVPDPTEAKVEDRFDDRSDARRAAMRISRARDLAFGVWDTKTEQFVTPFEDPGDTSINGP